MTPKSWDIAGERRAIIRNLYHSLPLTQRGLAQLLNVNPRRIGQLIHNYKRAAACEPELVHQIPDSVLHMRDFLHYHDPRELL